MNARKTRAGRAVGRWAFIFVTTLFLVSTQSSLRAEMVILQQGRLGYTGTSDTSIYEDFADNSAGGFAYLFAGVTKGAALRRTLIRFDLQGAIPPGATVTSASLYFYCDYGRAGASAVELRRLTRAWNEGDNQLTDQDNVGQGRPAQPGDATWDDVSFPSVAWATPGGEFVATASAAGTVSAVPGWAALTGAGLATDIQGWIAQPSENHGWMVLLDEPGFWNAKRFLSSEAPEKQPRLEVEFASVSGVGDWALY